jgi:hypothetical protein
LDCSRPALLVDGKFHHNIAVSLLRAYNTRRLSFQHDLVPALLGVLSVATGRNIELSTSCSQEFSTWSVRELKWALNRCNIDVTHILEKSELVRLAAEKAHFYEKDGTERGATVRALMQELILVVVSSGSSDLKVPIRNIPGFENLHGLRNVREESVRILSDPSDEAAVKLADGTEINLIFGDGEKSVATVMHCNKSVNSVLWIYEQGIWLGVREENGGDLEFTHSILIECNKFVPTYAQIVKACSKPGLEYRS